MQKTKVVGVTFDGRQHNISKVNPIVDKLIALREPDNPYDKNAIHIFVEKARGGRETIGYINRGLAAELAPEMDQGKQLIIHDYSITGSQEPGISMGVIIEYDLHPSLDPPKTMYGEAQ